jgi:PAS domain S-box-containing protein
MENARQKLRNNFYQRLGPDDQVSRLFDLIPGLSFFVKDRRGRFIALNQRGCEYCGVGSEEEAIGQTDHDFFPKQRADEYRADDVAVMESGTPIVNRVESAPESAGSPRLVMTNKIPLRDVRGRVIGIAGFSRQIDQVREQTGSADAFANVIEYLHLNYGENMSTEQLAGKARLSVSQFERRFRHAFGSSPRQYLMRVRVENAARILTETKQTVSEVALACGFYDHAHFSRSFRRIMNMSPSEHRSRHQRVAIHDDGAKRKPTKLT